jgi:hypothetical protein
VRWLSERVSDDHSWTDLLFVRPHLSDKVHRWSAVLGVSLTQNSRKLSAKGFIRLSETLNASERNTHCCRIASIATPHAWGWFRVRCQRTPLLQG